MEFGLSFEFKDEAHVETHMTLLHGMLTSASPKKNIWKDGQESQDVLFDREQMDGGGKGDRVRP